MRYPTPQTPGHGKRCSVRCPRIQSWVAENYLAQSTSHVRVASHYARSAAQHRTGSSRAREHCDNDAVCSCCTFHATSRNRYAEPQNGSKCKFWATRGQPIYVGTHELLLMSRTSRTGTSDYKAAERRLCVLAWAVELTRTYSRRIILPVADRG